MMIGGISPDPDGDTADPLLDGWPSAYGGTFTACVDSFSETFSCEYAGCLMTLKHSDQSHFKPLSC